jgi:hypothetical protein
MIPTKQFWTLVRFQYLLNPSLWALPLLVGIISYIPFLIHGSHSSYHSSLSFFFISNQVFFFVGIFGAMILSPEKFQFGRMRTANYSFNSEFLLTRAVDRPIVYRSRAFLLYALFLLVPIGSMIYFTTAPELVINEYSSALTSKVIDSIPGSHAVAESTSHGQPDIVIPHGRLLLAAWQVWIFLLSLMALQLAVSFLSPYKLGPRIFWVLVYLSLLGPAFLPLFFIETMKNLPFASVSEGAFFFFVEYQPGIWIGTLMAVVACHFVCEQIFVRQEQ